MADRPLEERFRYVIEKAVETTGKRAVVLVDEYDKPLLEGADKAMVEHNKAVFKGFFSTLKSYDHYLKFVFITGVTKFSKVSIFSDLNQLRDISLSADYSQICGITETELKENFAPEMWVDLTPDGFSGAVIRNIAVGYSYVVLDGSYYRLGEGSDGKGVLDVLLCDLNADDEPDLLYTYHFGTTEDGETKVGWFDCVDRRSVVSSFGMQKAYLALSEEDGAYLVYRCTRSVDETGAFALHFTDRIGEILEKGGELYLMME